MGKKDKNDHSINIKTNTGSIGDVSGGNMDTDRSINTNGGDFIGGDVGGSNKSGNASTLYGHAVTGSTPNDEGEGGKTRSNNIKVALITGFFVLAGAITAGWATGFFTKDPPPPVSTESPPKAK